MLQRRSLRPVLFILSHCLASGARVVPVLVSTAIFAAAAPVITRQPADVEVTSGQNATFTVAADGTGALTYQWRRHGQPIVSATEATFAIASARVGSADFYDVVVSDSTGSTTSDTVNLTVGPAAFPDHITWDREWDLQLESSQPGAVNELLPLPSGGFYAAGSFVSVNGTARSHVMRVRPDGSLDPFFVPDRMSDGEELQLARQDDCLIIGGRFRSVGGEVHRFLVRLLPNGVRDKTFNANLAETDYPVTAVLTEAAGTIVFATGGSGPGPIRRLHRNGTLERVFPVELEGSVEVLGLQSDGKIIAAGEFTTPDGSREDVVRLLSDGTLDPSFALPGGVDGVVRHLRVQADDSIVIAGWFDRIGEQPANGVARLQPNGAIDATFSTVAGSGKRDVQALAVREDGQVLIGGYRNEGNIVTGYLFEVINPNGTIADSDLLNADGAIQAIATLGDDRIAIGGRFSRLGGASRQSLAVATLTGTLASAPRFTTRSAGSASAVAALPTGKFVVVGDFDYARGVVARDILRLNADGTLDSTFNAGGGVTHGFGAIYTVLALPDGRIAIGGNFTRVDGISRPGLAILESTGTVDRGFAPETQTNQSVFALAQLPDGRLAAAGIRESQGFLTRYETDGGERPLPGGGRFDTIVETLAIQPDGRLLAGGNFTSYMGSPHGYVIRFDASGNVDPTFESGTGFNSLVSDIALTSAGRILVAGYFSQYDGHSAFGITRLNSNGSIESDFDSDVGAAVGSMLLQADGRIILRAASLQGFSGRGEIIRLQENGGIDTSFRAAGMTSTSSWSSLLMRDDGQLLMAGSEQFLATRPAVAPVITIPPEEQVVRLGTDAAISVSVDVAEDVTYQWYRNDEPIVGAMSSSIVIRSFSAADEGKYHVTITNPFGTVTSDAVSVRAPSDERGRLINLSVRSRTGDGADTLIVGFMVAGDLSDAKKPLLIRGVGPTLAASFNVPTAVSDSRIELFNAENFMIDANDDWDGVFDFSRVGAFGLGGSPVRDAAIYNPVAAIGTYSVHVRGKGAGIVLAEVYDATATNAFTEATPRLVNLSARAVVGSGDAVLISGFVVGGSTPIRLLIRAAGPALALAPFNISGVLSDPRLTILDEHGNTLAGNEDWHEDEPAALAAAFSSLGAFSFADDSADAALLVTLSPGLYFVQVQGADTQVGVALVEIYESPEDA